MLTVPPEGGCHVVPGGDVCLGAPHHERREAGVCRASNSALCRAVPHLPFPKGGYGSMAVRQRRTAVPCRAVLRGGTAVSHWPAPRPRRSASSRGGCRAS